MAAGRGLGATAGGESASGSDALFVVCRLCENPHVPSHMLEEHTKFCQIAQQCDQKAVDAGAHLRRLARLLGEATGRAGRRRSASNASDAEAVERKQAAQGRAAAAGAGMGLKLPAMLTSVQASLSRTARAKLLQRAFSVRGSREAASPPPRPSNSKRNSADLSSSASSLLGSPRRLTWPSWWSAWRQTRRSWSTTATRPLRPCRTCCSARRISATRSMGRRATRWRCTRWFGASPRRWRRSCRR